MTGKEVAERSARSGGVLLAAATIAVSMLAFEAAMHLLPLQANDHLSTISYRYDAELGYTINPGRHRYASACFVAESRINEAGFRDRPWTEPADIALLGDSFVQASEVPENWTTARLLERMTGARVQSIGVQGHGTVTQSLMFDRAVNKPAPRHVILVFVENDFADSYCPLARRFGTSLAKPCIESDGQLYQPQPRTSWDDALSTLRAHCMSCRAARFAYTRLTTKARYSGEFFDGLPFYFQTYDPTFFASDPDMIAARRVVERAILDIARKVERSGGTFHLLQAPSHIETTDDIARDFGHRAFDPAGFARLEPNIVRRWMRAFAMENGISMIDPLDYMLEYRRLHALPPPFFTFRCDKHFNPLGHVLLASFIADAIGGQPSTVLSTAPDRLIGAKALANIVSGQQLSASDLLEDPSGVVFSGK